MTALGDHRGSPLLRLYHNWAAGKVCLRVGVV